jgi:chromate reductase, NAD(P)H dehydrogenase (quinone)
MRVLTISGSLRPDSYNGLLLRALEEQAPAGVELHTFEGLADIPHFHGDRTDPDPVPEAVERLRREIERSDAVLIATPEYNGSIPGTLKNALDWASVPFPDNALKGKPVAVIGASTGGYGGMWAQAELRKVLGIIGARVVPADFSLAHAHQQFDEHGSLKANQAGRLALAMEQLLAEAQPLAA